MFTKQDSTKPNDNHAGNLGEPLKQTLARDETLAKRYDVSKRQIQLWAQEGVIPRIVLGRRCVRYPVEECDQALQNYKG